MQRITTFILFFLICLVVQAQNSGNEVATIRKQMADIRKNTDWNDSEAAKVANAKVEALSVKLTQAIRNSKAPVQQPQDGNNTETATGIQQEMDDYSNDLWNQMMKIVREGGQWDMAEPLRKEIVEEYKEDESLRVACPEFLDEMTYLCINMEMPGVQAVIDQMENYKAIQTLVITGGKHGATVDLEMLMAKAAKYPLQQLYIINFRNFVTKIPKAISNFQELTLLTLYNNQIIQLPAELNSLISLKKLYVDMNPIVALIPTINKLNNLDSLGIAKTKITEDEIARINQQLPNCKILLK